VHEEGQVRAQTSIPREGPRDALQEGDFLGADALVFVERVAHLPRGQTPIHGGHPLEDAAYACERL